MITYDGVPSGSTCQAVYTVYSSKATPLDDGTLLYPGPGESLFEASLRAQFQERTRSLAADNRAASAIVAWTCGYCGQSNNAQREKCCGCQAPRRAE